MASISLLVHVYTCLFLSDICFTARQPDRWTTPVLILTIYVFTGSGVGSEGVGLGVGFGVGAAVGLGVVAAVGVGASVSSTYTRDSSGSFVSGVSFVIPSIAMIATQNHQYA